MTDPQFPYLHVKNWRQFQHYSKRNPPWIKLHRSLFTDQDFMSLSERSQYDLIRLWMVASTSDGCLMNDVCLLRHLAGMKWHLDLKPLISKGFLIPSASKMLADCKQDASALDRDRDRDRIHTTPLPPSTEITDDDIPDLEEPKHKKPRKKSNGVHLEYPPDFEKLWAIYPRGEGKGEAYKAFLKLKPKNGELEKLITSVEEHKKTTRWNENDGKYIPHLSTYLNSRRFDDRITNQELDWKFINETD